MNAGDTTIAAQALLDGPRPGWRVTMLPAASDGPDAPSPAAWAALIDELLRDPSSLAGYAVLKYSGGVQVCRARVGNGAATREVICKQSRVDGFLRRRLAAFRPSRARQAAQRAGMLRSAGIATAEPLVILESNRADRESWLITSALEAVADLDHVAMALLPRTPAGESPRIRRALSQTVAELLARFGPAGLHHRDLKASNILLTRWNHAPTAWIVDVDGVSRCGAGAVSKERQRLVRLGASLVATGGLGVTDAARMMTRYAAATGRPRKAWKTLFRECGPLVAAYNRRAAGRKTTKIDGYGG